MGEKEDSVVEAEADMLNASVSTLATGGFYACGAARCGGRVHISGSGEAWRSGRACSSSAPARQDGGMLFFCSTAVPATGCTHCSFSSRQNGRIPKASPS
ncbi:Os12g0246300 [Oryza sativa Japonica Group]|uniref:Os12g0246300 protein n=1 Tax=Oryza sativa subsp. japonica TaxID=39947 RepID=A0A0P0Y8N1_ORYSJ|nr:hypothetical protein DAI22_12g083050 [Oryza sativa Japonica Group]BAT16526.1 Os12g0246300 [Oryza sativa Japonica Group]